MGYYNSFNLDVATLDTPFWTICMGSFDEFLFYFDRVSKAWAAAVPILMLAYIGLYVWWGTRKPKQEPIASGNDRISLLAVKALKQIGLFIFALCLVLVAPFSAGKYAGSSEWRGEPLTRIMLYFRPAEASAFPKTLLDGNVEGKLRLLVQTKDLVVVFIAKTDEQKPQKSRSAYVIGRNNLEAVCQVSTSPGSPAPDNTCNSVATQHDQ